MKKYLLMMIGGALAVGCSENENLNQASESTSEGITFCADKSAVTRDARMTGSEAAAKLNNHFVVYGTKHLSAEDGTAANDKVVFNQYNVEWVDNTAGTTLSNTHNWDYVGKTAYLGESVTQGIKYWDYAAVGYTFYAFSSKNISYPAAATDLVKVTKVTADPAETDKSKYNKGYMVEVKEGASLAEVLFSDRVEVAKANFGMPVTMTFRSFGAKVRVGFYETVAGYKVKIKKFYIDKDATAAVTDFTKMVDGNTTNFSASLQNVNPAKASAVTVTYYDEAATGYTDHAKINNTTADYNYYLTLGTNLIGNELGTSTTTVTYDAADGSYTGVYPFETNTNPMLIKLDYTLEAEDGQGETIEIKNARVLVPAQYVQWKGNFCYTYLFKITERSNGHSGEDGPEGLYPISFDAVSEADDGFTQETTTTLASNSVTSYATDGYKTGKNIYFVTNKITDGSLVVPAAVGPEATKAQMYCVTGTGAATATETDVFATLTGSPNGLSLTATSASAAASLVYQVPANDGSQYTFGTSSQPAALKFTPGAAGTYAYVYCTTQYVAPVYEAAGDTYSPATTYYAKTAGGVYYAASGITSENYASKKATLFKLKTPAVPGVYDIKVVTVK